MCVFVCLPVAFMYLGNDYNLQLMNLYTSLVAGANVSDKYTQ